MCQQLRLKHILADFTDTLIKPFCLQARFDITFSLSLKKKKKKKTPRERLVEKSGEHFIP